MGSLQFPNMGMGLRLAAFGRRSSATTSPSLLVCYRYVTGVLRYLGPKLWGKLSTDDRTVKTLNEFKRHICGKHLTTVNRRRLQGFFNKF